MGKLRGREPAAEIGRMGAVQPQVVRAVEYIGVRDLARRAADGDIDPVISDQETKLLGQIFPEQARPGDANRVDAGLVEPPEGARGKLGALAVLIVDPKLRIGEQALGPRLRIRPLTAGEVTGERASKRCGRLVEHLAKFVHKGWDVVYVGQIGSFLSAGSLAMPEAAARVQTPLLPGRAGHGKVPSWPSSISIMPR
jgi:hypothetical protein